MCVSLPGTPRTRTQLLDRLYRQLARVRAQARATLRLRRLKISLAAANVTNQDSCRSWVEEENRLAAVRRVAGYETGASPLVSPTEAATQKRINFAATAPEFESPPPPLRPVPRLSATILEYLPSGWMEEPEPFSSYGAESDDDLFADPINDEWPVPGLFERRDFEVQGWDKIKWEEEDTSFTHRVGFEEHYQPLLSLLTAKTLHTSEL